MCSRCVRACDEVQGTFALTIQGRGFGSKVSASQSESFLRSEVADHDQPVGRGKWQGAQKNALDDGEDGGGGTDAEGQREHRGQRKSG